jgi:hypothetical protein
MESGRGFGASEPFHRSSTGHGTWMAYMMSRICPNVKLFVCKLDVLRHESGRKANFTARSAADVGSPSRPALSIEGVDTRSNNRTGGRICSEP